MLASDLSLGGNNELNKKKYEENFHLSFYRNEIGLVDSKFFLPMIVIAMRI